jgi:drebrin-like protein
LYDFQANTKEAISFPKDAIIDIIQKDGDWWVGEYNGQSGLLPYNYVQSIGNNGGKFA